MEPLPQSPSNWGGFFFFVGFRPLACGSVENRIFISEIKDCPLAKQMEGLLIGLAQNLPQLARRQPPEDFGILVKLRFLASLGSKVAGKVIDGLGSK